MFAVDNINKDQSGHLFTTRWGLAAGRSRTYVFYVLAGDWSSALAFQSNPPLHYYSVNPCRAVDTRNTGQRFSSNSSAIFQIAGVCDIPANAAAVAFDLTAVNATADVTLELYPGDLGSPPGTIEGGAKGDGVNGTRASNAVIALARNGNGTVGAAATFGAGSLKGVDLLLDVSGYFAP